MLNCRDMTRLISDSMEQRISVRQRIEIWMHVLMCGLCRRFRADAISLRRRLRKLDAESVSAASRQRLPEECKQKICRAIARSQQP